jgi:hypothetical protein
MTSKRVAADKAARRHPAVAVATLAELPSQPALGVDELIAFLGDRDETFRMLRALRIAAYDPARPVRVPINRVRAWQARSLTAARPARGGRRSCA